MCFLFASLVLSLSLSFSETTIISKRMKNTKKKQNGEEKNQYNSKSTFVYIINKQIKQFPLNFNCWKFQRNIFYIFDFFFPFNWFYFYSIITHDGFLRKFVTWIRPSMELFYNRFLVYLLYNTKNIIFEW